MSHHGQGQPEGEGADLPRDARRAERSSASDWPGTPPANASQAFWGGPLGALRPCPACGVAVLASASWCQNCGAEFFSPRSKRTAVVLAVFLTFWTWYYTYRKDKAKFWLALALSTLALFFPQAGLGYVILTCVWIWAVVDAAIKPVDWYRRYPSRR